LQVPPELKDEFIEEWQDAAEATLEKEKGCKIYG
jgi:hypothetical protein